MILSWFYFLHRKPAILAGMWSLDMSYGLCVLGAFNVLHLL